MAARNLKSLEEGHGQLKAQDLDVHALELDVSRVDSVEKGIKKILGDFKRVDILINNAGVFADGLKEDVENLARTLEATFRTNTIGPALMIQSLLPPMKKNNFGRVVNVSSGMAGLTEMAGGSLAYRASKAALNAVTRVFAQECEGRDILVNAVCPGWVKTDMGGAGAKRSIPEGVASILWAAELPKGGPTGGFFRDGKALEW
jgi:NAD(P)-dependent dehydrogenase (short-subunit alcohol dehydrogenase family)